MALDVEGMIDARVCGRKSPGLNPALEPVHLGLPADVLDKLTIEFYSEPSKAPGPRRCMIASRR